MQVREFLEKNYGEESPAGDDAVKLCVKSLMEMVDASGSTIEVMVMKTVDGKAELSELDPDAIDAVVKDITKEVEAAEAARRAQADNP